MPPGQTSIILHIYLVRFISLKQYNLTSYILKGLYVLVYCYLHLWLPSYSHLQLYLSLWLYYLYLYWTATVPSLHQGRGLQQPSPILIRNKWTVEIGQPVPVTHWSFFHLIRKRIKKMPLIISLLSRLLSTKGGFISDMRKKPPHFLHFHRHLGTITIFSFLLK